MLIQVQPPLHLTYCLNIHPGETWRENFEAICDKAVAVRERVCAAGTPFGLGLRLGRRSAGELAQGPALEEFAAFLQAQKLYAFTINGFPYGTFHAAPVKQDVYRPDWRDGERLEYTKLLADILARLLPQGVGGSISTVPGSYKSWIETPADVERMAENLADMAAFLDDLRQRTGKEIVLALEPEPDCYVETTEEAIRFFQDALLIAGRKHIERARGRSARESEEIIRCHLGVCLDLAHAAVEFERPGESLRRLASAGIAVAKVQLSAALAAQGTPDVMERLKEFGDEVYLHQVKVRTGAVACRPVGTQPRSATDEADKLLSYPDLPAAMADPIARGPGCEWRIHFHVPLFSGRYGPLQSTASLLEDAFWRQLKGGASEHLEIETYTFGVLPEGLRAPDVVDNVVREYRWVLERIRDARIGDATLFPPRK